MAAELEAAFRRLESALAAGDLPTFWGMILPDAVIMDEDLPVRVDRQGFQDHIGFHSPEVWENFAWKPMEVRFVARESAAVVAGSAMFRGKPRGSGYRLRPLLFTQGWSKLVEGWRLASWQQSPLVGHVTKASPG